ncbi:MAG: hypothetical protein K1X78_11220 [Verrucomicrobiaceae bacterium]|nr:hypothetical protein [Verrucomicrobiaceae bacterium]
METMGEGRGALLRLTGNRRFAGAGSCAALVAAARNSAAVFFADASDFPSALLIAFSNACCKAFTFFRAAFAALRASLNALRAFFSTSFASAALDFATSAFRIASSRRTLMALDVEEVFLLAGFVFFMGSQVGW